MTWPGLHELGGGTAVFCSGTCRDKHRAQRGAGASLVNVASDLPYSTDSHGARYSGTVCWQCHTPLTETVAAS